MNEHVLTQEFVRLRHGRGLADTNLRTRTGPGLIDLCRVDHDDNDRIIRLKVLGTITSLTVDFPHEDRLAVNFALGTSPDTQHRLLSTRLELLAHQLNCAERTARRRVDHAFERLTEEAMARRVRMAAAADDDPEKGWYVQRLDALLRLDTPAPEVTETRTIVARRAGLERIAIRFSVPRSDPQAEGPSRLCVDVSRGARIDVLERQGDTHFRLVLTLARKLAIGEEHTYTVIFRIPPDQPMRNHYALIPLADVESFHVRVRFDPHRPPATVTRFDRLPPRTLDDRRIPGRALTLDDAREIDDEFTGLERGFAYGVTWRTP